MAKYTEEEIRQKIADGWIRANLWFEVLSPEKETTADAMKKHLEKLKKEKGTMVVAETFDEVMEVENPIPQVEKAFSQSVEVDMLANNIETLLYDVIFFGPSAVEIIEPKDLKIGINTMQTIMNSVADLVHRYAAQGGGGIIISTK